MPALTGTLCGLLLPVSGETDMDPQRGRVFGKKGRPFQAIRENILKPSCLVALEVGACICTFAGRENMLAEIPLRVLAHIWAVPIQPLAHTHCATLGKSYSLPGPVPPSALEQK